MSDMPGRRNDVRPSTPRQIPPIMEALEVTDKLVDELEQAVGRLSERLGPFLLSDDGTAKTTAQASGNTSDVGRRINETNEHLVILRSWVTSLADRLDR